MNQYQHINSKTLTSLALMEVNVLASDYISSFLPFIATLILKKDYNKIEIGIIIKDFKEEFGISITRAPMQSILSKAVAKSLILAAQDGTYKPIISELQKFSFLSVQEEHQKKIDILLNNFISYVNTQHNIIVSNDEAIDIFMGFLDEYSPRTVSGKYIDSEYRQGTSNKNLYLMGDFIKTISHNDTNLFNIVQQLSMSYLIASALTFDEPTKSGSQEFQNMTFYLDTPIVLRLLGLQTQELKESYVEMFRNFTETLNPQYMIFQHTLEEISGIIHDCAEWIDNPQYNPMYANPALLSFVEKHFNKIQIELFAQKLEQTLLDMNISIDDMEYYNIVNHKSQIDLRKLKNKLVETYKKNNPQYDEEKHRNALDYDISSIEKIVKLWGEKSTHSYTRLKYLFITNNNTLAYVCRKYTSEYWWNNKSNKSPCVTDYYLGTMVWLSTPAPKMQNIVKLKLLADCSAATSLSREVMEKFIYELNRMQKEQTISDNDFLLLRQSAYDNNYIQKITLNEETAFKDDTIEQILEEIKTDIQRPMFEQIKEKEKQIELLKQEKTMLENENRCNKEKIDKINIEKEIKKEIKQKCLEREKYQIEKQANKKADSLYKLYFPSICAICTLILVILNFALSPFKFDKIVKIFLGVIAFILAIFIAMMNNNTFSLRDKLCNFLCQYYKRKK